MVYKLHQQNSHMSSKNELKAHHSAWYGSILQENGIYFTFFFFYFTFNCCFRYWIFKAALESLGRVM